VAGLALVTVAAVVAAVGGYRASTRARRHLAGLSHLDLLTGLPNRAAFEASLQALLSGGPSAGRVTVLAIELQRFAVINETYGFEVGDALMAEVAGHLRDALRRSEVLARIGGAQFAVASPAVSTQAVARARAAELQQVVRAPFRIGRDTLRIAANVGFVVTDHQADSAAEVLLDTGAALTEAHARGPNSVVAYELALRTRLAGATAEARLREALDNQEYWLLYMPVVSVLDHQIVGVEALLRWADPERGLMGTAEFLDQLEQTGLIVPVGAWAIDEACRQSRVWMDQFPHLDLTTTVNVSTRQLADEEFVPGVLEPALTTHDVPPDKLCLEITEGGTPRDQQATWPTLRLAKELGVQLALDDFGVGFASLTTIRSAQLDVLKIEPTFVQAVTESREGLAIVQQIVGMAHDLGLTPVAEGVDHADQAEALRGVGCDLGQGYYYGKPQPVDVIDKLLKRGRVSPGEDSRQAIDWSGGSGAPRSPAVDQQVGPA
jgi:diguanylate cyclase (GGDEF)-like protein